MNEPDVSARRAWPLAKRALPAAMSGALAFIVAERLGLVTVIGVRRLLDVSDSGLLFVAALICGGLALTRAQWLAWVGPGAVLALYLVVVFTPLFDGAIRGWLLRDEPRRADAIVVLSSDVTDDGHISSNGLSRYVAALAMAREGLAPLLVRTRIPAPRPDDSADAREIAAGTEVEMATVGPVSSTRDEAVRTAELMRARGLSRVIVVTEPMHERRAAAAFRAVGLEVVALPAPERDYSLPGLGSGEDRLRAFHDWITERAAWTLYSMRGWVRDGGAE